MLDWIKNINKDFPEFWIAYSAKFSAKTNRFVVISTETTGLSPNKDVILSLAAFAVVDDRIFIGDSFESTVLQYKYFHENNIFNENAVESKVNKLSEADAIQEFIEYLGNAVLVGHHVNFDVEIINAALEKIGCGKLKNEALDISVMYEKFTDTADKNSSLDELAAAFKIPKTGRNTSSEDAYRIALLFLKLKSRLGIK
jgi:DNA polymerase-3 subunit epsilon